MADIPRIAKILVRSKWKDVSQAPSIVLTNEGLTECSVFFSSSLFHVPGSLLTHVSSEHWTLNIMALASLVQNPVDWSGIRGKGYWLHVFASQGHQISSRQKAVTKKRAVLRLGIQWLMRRTEDKVCFQHGGKVSSVELMVQAIQL